MICPTCGWDNVPGNEACSHCQHSLTPLDRPSATNRIERSLMEDRVRDLCSNPPTTLGPNATIREAVDLMLEKNVGAVLVVDADQKLLGIFSERDLLKKIAGNYALWQNLRIGDFMTAKPATVSANDTLNFVLHKMDGGGYRHLPVLENGRPQRVVSVRDMMRFLIGMCDDPTRRPNTNGRH